MNPMLSLFLAAAALAGRPLAAPPAPPAAKEVEGTIWPAVTTTDFKLTVELVAQAKKDSKGVLHIENKTTLSVKLKAEKDCEAAVYWIDTKGQVVQLFPNRFDRDGRLKAGVERVVPGNKEYDLEAVTTEGKGVEFLRVVASSAPLPAMPKGEAMGPYIAFRTEAARKEVIKAVRGVVVRDKEKPVSVEKIEIAHTELRFCVNP